MTYGDWFKVLRPRRVTPLGAWDPRQRKRFAILLATQRLESGAEKIPPVELFVGSTARGRGIRRARLRPAFSRQHLGLRRYRCFPASLGSRDVRELRRHYDPKRHAGVRRSAAWRKEYLNGQPGVGHDVDDHALPAGWVRAD